MKEKEAIRIHVCCLKATAKDNLPIGKLLFDDALYSLPSALADGQMRDRTSSRAKRDDFTTNNNLIPNKKMKHNEMKL